MKMFNFDNKTGKGMNRFFLLRIYLFLLFIYCDEKGVKCYALRHMKCNE